MAYLNMQDLNGMGARGDPACGPILDAANSIGISARAAPPAVQADLLRQEAALRAEYEACLEAARLAAVAPAPAPSAPAPRAPTMDCSTPQFNARYASGSNPYNPMTQPGQYQDWQCRILRHSAALREKAAASAAAQAATSTGRSSSAPTSAVTGRTVTRPPPASIAASSIVAPPPVTEISTQQAAAVHAQGAISRAGLFSTSRLGPLSITPFQTPDIQLQKRASLSTAVWVGIGVVTLSLFAWLALGKRKG